MKRSAVCRCAMRSFSGRLQHHQDTREDSHVLRGEELNTDIFTSREGDAAYPFHKREQKRACGQESWLNNVTKSTRGHAEQGGD